MTTDEIKEKIKEKNLYPDPILESSVSSTITSNKILFDIFPKSPWKREKNKYRLKWTIDANKKNKSLNTLQASYEVLKTEWQPMHYKKITKIIMEKWLTEKLKWATPDFSVNSTLNTNLLKIETPFTKVKTWVFWLKERVTSEDDRWFATLATEKEQPSDVIEADEYEEEVQVKTSTQTEETEKKKHSYTQFIWKAGELAVCSELLMRWWNANILMVDDGVDIFALKENEKIHVQVKTSAKPSTSSIWKVYHFSIGEKAFERHKHGEVFYVFVARTSEEYNSYIIMNYYNLRNLIDTKVIKKSTWNRWVYGVHITFHEDENYSINKHPINEFVNNRSPLHG